MSMRRRSILSEDDDHCETCGEWDLVGSGHEVGEPCPDAPNFFGSDDDHRVTQKIRSHRGEWRGETYQFYLTTPRGRRDYICNYCGEGIDKGVRHVVMVTVGLEGPGMETWRLHGECYLAPGSMFDNSGRPDWRWLGPEV